MASSGPGPGQSPFGGSRHRSRPARPVFAPPAPQEEPPQLNQTPEAVALDVCPWLYLNIEPDTRGASVSDGHRCELSPDTIPGPGHQVGYCLTPNHRGCPQLRGYEAQRRAVALENQQQAQILPFPGQPQPQPQPPAGRRNPYRWIWIALGALGIMGLTATLLLYAMPGLSTAVIEQEPTEAQAAPAASAQADAEAAATTIASDDIPDTYVVQFGDTLSSIARRFGVTIDELISANDLDDGSLLVSIGDELVLPKP
jgi:LysM domain-containing protein